MTALYSDIQSRLLKPGLRAGLLHTIYKYIYFFIVLPQAESSAPVPVSNTVSQNEAVDLFVTSEITDPKEPIWKALAHPSSAPRYISSASTDGARTRGEIKIIPNVCNNCF